MNGEILLMIRVKKEASYYLYMIPHPINVRLRNVGLEYLNTLIFL